MAKPSPKLEKLLSFLESSKIEDVNIVKEIEQSFLDYSMSVITSRALPDIKDGLKPVHRRIIFAAHQEGLYNNKKFKKSAALVGAVMGSYHPHGDLSIYEALARLSQDFNMRYPLIEGQGNFGSIDGDSPAAMRYTEVKLSKLGEYFLDGIKEDCVDFVPNYDGSKEEPVVLPTILPNILLNGCTGIAVGLATNIPPHNLSELCNAILALIKNPELTCEDLLDYIKGPDFPTGAEVLNYEGVKQYICTGHGGFFMRAKVDIVEEEKKNLLIVKEIPYGIKKTNLIQKIVRLVKPAKHETGNEILINSIINIRDESNLEGIRLIIECKKDISPKVILNHLYKYTPLQDQYSANMTVLVNMQPKVLNILDMFKEYLKQQVEILVRRTKFNLEKIKQHIHILEGRTIVSENLKDVIDIISNADEPEEEIKNKYQLSETQIKDIFALPLKSIKKIEKLKLSEELTKSVKSRDEYIEILENPEKQFEIIEKRIIDLKEAHGDERRTQINVNSSGIVKKTDLIPVQKVVIILSEKGYISQTPLKNFKIHKRGGVGVKGSVVYQDDQVKILLTCYPIEDILAFTNYGKVYRFKAYQLNLSSNRSSKGQNIVNLLNFAHKNEKIVTIMTLNDEDYEKNISLLFATKHGTVKRTLISLFKRININGKRAFQLKENDSLKFVIKTNDESDVMLASSLGKLVRFKATDVRNMGRTACGVRGIKLDKKSELISVTSSYDGKRVMSISQRGIGKITNLDAYRLTKRGSVGVITQKITPKTGKLLSCISVGSEEQILLMTNKGKVNRFKISDVSVLRRCTSGVTLFKLEDKDEKIIYCAKNTIEVDEKEENFV